MKLRPFLLILALLTPTVFTGCGGGGTTHTTVQSNNQTLGKQLTDLDEAYKSGAITKSEYERARKKLLSNYPYK